MGEFQKRRCRECVTQWLFLHFPLRGAFLVIIVLASVNLGRFSALHQRTDTDVDTSFQNVPWGGMQPSLRRVGTPEEVKQSLQVRFPKERMGGEDDYDYYDNYGDKKEREKEKKKKETKEKKKEDFEYNYTFSNKGGKNDSAGEKQKKELEQKKIEVMGGTNDSAGKKLKKEPVQEKIEVKGSTNDSAGKNQKKDPVQKNIEVCLSINSVLNVTAWPRVIYHKDLPNYDYSNKRGMNANYDHQRFSSLEEEDRTARSTVQGFNDLRPSVLTRRLLEAGFTPGGEYPARIFARRLVEAFEGRGPPLLIWVFGNSFTIGSNCGESSVHLEAECSWPGRLTRRIEEIFTRPNVEWRMFQSNGQSSANIAQMLPSILEEYHSKNVTPDAILLDNTLSDRVLRKPWFEAVARVLTNSFPRAVKVSIVDARREFLIPKKDSNVDIDPFIQQLRQTQQHYSLTVVDIPKMVDVLHRNESYSSPMLKNRILKLITEMVNLTDTEPLDLLWPQARRYVSSDGTKLTHRASRRRGVHPLYFGNFLPKTQSTKPANYPNNHPPWPTHQYVADAVTYALLRVVQEGTKTKKDIHINQSFESGLGCEKGEFGQLILPAVIKETIAPKPDIDACFICLRPLTQIDARSTPNISNYTYTNSISAKKTTNITAITRSGRGGRNTSRHHHDPVAVTCGDWKWVTDERNRSGWQSDQFRSLIRFRLKVSDTPIISLTHMKSHETFGYLRVSFRAVTKEEEQSVPLACGGIDNPDESNTPLPSLFLRGDIDEFSTWDTTVFPANHDDRDMNSLKYWDLLNQTVLGRDGVEYVDLYVENPNKPGGRTRIKIQTVTSC